jgi:hypothetical protein
MNELVCFRFNWLIRYWAEPRLDYKPHPDFHYLCPTQHHPYASTRPPCLCSQEQSFDSRRVRHAEMTCFCSAQGDFPCLATFGGSLCRCGEGDRWSTIGILLRRSERHVLEPIYMRNQHKPLRWARLWLPQLEIRWTSLQPSIPISQLASAAINESPSELKIATALWSKSDLSLDKRTGTRKPGGKIS